MANKKSVIGTMIDMSGTMKEYNKATSLFERNEEKIKDVSKGARIREEILSNIKTAIETLERLERVYSKVKAEVDKENENSLYSPQERESYLNVIEARLKIARSIKDEIIKIQ